MLEERIHFFLRKEERVHHYYTFEILYIMTHIIEESKDFKF